MKQTQYRWHWRCNECGRESPSSAVRCPRCNALLQIHGSTVADDPEPDLPKKPYTGSEEAPPVKPEKVKKEKPKKAPRQKREHRGGGKTVLSILLLLMVLLLGALVLILLDRGVPDTPVQTNPPVMQTQPADTTQPQPTAPPTTDPPATVPPTTVPPTTVPPTTVPPTTVPPTTEPPETQPSFPPNTLRATIHDEVVEFQLSRAYVTSSEINANYVARNPRGEDRYYIYINFDKNMTVGTHNATADILRSKVDITFAYANDTNNFYRTYRRNGNNSEITGTLVIEDMSADWMTYDGSFSAELVLYGKSDTIVIEDAVFNFTLEQ